MKNKSFCTIKVLDQGGSWYDNAFIENDFDAIRVAKFYRDQLGYSVQLWNNDRNLTALLDSTKSVLLSKRS